MSAPTPSEFRTRCEVLSRLLGESKPDPSNEAQRSELARPFALLVEDVGAVAALCPAVEAFAVFQSFQGALEGYNDFLLKVGADELVSGNRGLLATVQLSLGVSDKESRRALRLWRSAKTKAAA